MGRSRVDVLSPPGVDGTTGLGTRGTHPSPRLGGLPRPPRRSVHGRCGGPVLDVEVVHLDPAVEVALRHVRVVARRRDHDEPERGSARRRGSAGLSM